MRSPYDRQKGPLVSTIITAFNVAPYIGQAIESALNQTYAQTELIVVDDGSTDSSAEKINAITDSRVRIIHQPNAGASAARNTGIAEARGEYLAFLDGDDFWAPEKLERQVAFHESHPDVDLSFSLSRVVNTSGKIIGILKAHKAGPVSFTDLLIDNKIRSGSSVMVRTAAMKEAGGFDSELRACTDYSGWLRVGLLRPGNIWCIAEPLDYYRRREGQITSDWQRLRDAHRQLLDKLDAATPHYGRARKLSECNMQRYYAYLAYAGGRRREAVKCLLESLRAAPVRFMTEPRSWVMMAAIASRSVLSKRLHDRLEESAFGMWSWLLSHRYGLNRGHAGGG